MNQNLLAMDTSTQRASIALSMHGVIYAETESVVFEHARNILPMIERVLTAADASIADLDGIVFGRGPGSFTGLRIACSVAKGLAYAHDLPLFSISSLASIAEQVLTRTQEQLPVLAMMDARMNQVYWGFFTELTQEARECVTNPEAVVIPETMSFILAGVGLDNYLALLPEALQDTCVRHEVIHPDAAAMIRLVAVNNTQPVDLANAEPVYIRNQVTHTQGKPHG